MKNHKWFLDIGSGHNPHPDCNLFLEKYLKNNSKHRAGYKFELKENMIKGDCCYLPFKDKSISKVFCNNVIEHLDYPDIFINECNRVSNDVEITTISLILEVYGKIGLKNGLYKSGLNSGHVNAFFQNGNYLSLKELYSLQPNLLLREKVLIKIINLLPITLHSFFFINLLWIIEKHCNMLDESILRVKLNYKNGKLME